MDNFVILSHEEVAEQISNAKVQVVYTAPAMEDNIANEIVRFVKRTSKEQVSVTMDLSAEVYREGYGDPTALDTLNDASIRIKNISGLRIGLLIVDDKGWIYNPISKATSPHLANRHYNSFLRDINGSLFEDYILIPIEHEQVSLFEIEIEEKEVKNNNIQEESITEEKINRIKESISEKPLPNFEVLRSVTEYRRLIQFIEITFSGARIEQKTVKLPSELLNVSQDKDFEEKMKATYKLFSEDISEYTKDIKEKIDRLREKYTYSLSKKYGRIILVANKKDFEENLQDLRQEIDKYKHDLSDYIRKQIDRTKNDLIKYFTPVLMSNPPSYLKDSYSNDVSKEEVQDYIARILDKDFPSSNQILSRINLDFTYKDITEETLNDNNFLDDLDKVFKNEPIRFPHQNNHQEILTFNSGFSSENKPYIKAEYTKNNKSFDIYGVKGKTEFPKYFDDLVVFGESILVNKTTDFKEFSYELINEFGKKVLWSLMGIYVQSLHNIGFPMKKLDNMIGEALNFYRELLNYNRR